MTGYDYLPNKYSNNLLNKLAL